MHTIIVDNDHVMVNFKLNYSINIVTNNVISLFVRYGAPSLSIDAVLATIVDGASAN